MQTTHSPNTIPQELLSHRTSERITALLLILYSIAQIVTIVTRIASSADQPDAFSSIAMISANHSWYLASKIANLAAAFLLLAASVFIFRVFRSLDGTLALLAAVLLGTAGIFWLHSSPFGSGFGRHLRCGGPRDCGPVQQYGAIRLLRHRTGPGDRRPGGIYRGCTRPAVLSALIVFGRPLSRWLGWAGGPLPSPCSLSGILKRPPCTDWAAAHCLIWLLLVAVLLAWKGTANSVSSEENPITGDFNA